MEIPYFETPADAIFKGNYSKKGTPMFESQVELSDILRHNSKTGFLGKNDLTVRSALSQIFTGERNLSKTLKHALFLVIEPLFDKRKYDYIKFEKLLITRFQEAYEKRITEKRERKGDRDYDKLIEVTRLGKQFLITTLEPAELHKSELADRLKNELLEKTNIVPRISAIKSELGKYKFYLPDKRVARQFWEALKRHAVIEYNLEPKLVERKLQQAHEKKIILTYIAPITVSMNPYVFIDYEDDTKVTGFCVSYRDTEIPSVAELSILAVDTWLNLIYKKQKKKIESLKNDYCIF